MNDFYQQLKKVLPLFLPGTTIKDLLKLHDQGHIDLDQMLKMEWVK